MLSNQRLRVGKETPAVPSQTLSEPKRCIFYLLSEVCLYLDSRTHLSGVDSRAVEEGGAGWCRPNDKSA